MSRALCTNPRTNSAHSPLFVQYRRFKCSLRADSGVLLSLKFNMNNKAPSQQMGQKIQKDPSRETVTQAWALTPSREQAATNQGVVFNSILPNVVMSESSRYRFDPASPATSFLKA